MATNPRTAWQAAAWAAVATVAGHGERAASWWHSVSRRTTTELFATHQLWQAALSSTCGDKQLNGHRGQA